MLKFRSSRISITAYKYQNKVLSLYYIERKQAVTQESWITACCEGFDKS